MKFPVPICLGLSFCLAAAGTQVYLTLYATGVRRVSSISGVTATLAGIPATVVYAGPQASYPALDQVNLLVDPFTGPRVVDLVLTVDGWESNTVQVQFR